MSWGRTVTLPEEEAPWVFPEQPKAEVSPASVEASTQYVSPSAGSFDGEIFWKGITGGYIDEIENLDYWTLRKRSTSVFYSNMYARGLIRRLVTNVIHTGLRPEWMLTRNHDLLGITKEQAKGLQRTYEKRFGLYCSSPEIIDIKKTRTDGELQAQIYLEAMIAGDCLVINRRDRDTQLPQLQIVNGDRVQTPIEYAMDPNVVDGVRIDAHGQHVGYYVYQGTVDVFDDRYVYVPARGTKSGRKTAWMVYGCDKREDGIRGEPLLGIVLQGLNDLNSYKGSSLLKAKINAMIVGSVENTTGELPSLPLSGGAKRKTEHQTDPADAARKVKLNEIAPGFWAEELARGEKFSAYAISGSDVNFGQFEATITAGIAWALQIPPEILMLSFNKAFNASQAALNEFNMFLGKERPRFASEHCHNLAEEWQVAAALTGKIDAPGFLEARRLRNRYDIKRAWLTTDWLGSVKPTTDIKKQAEGFEKQTKNGWTTNGRVSRAVNGTKFEDNVETLAEENAMLANAMRPLLELQREFGASNVKDVAAMAGVTIPFSATNKEEAA